MTRTSPPKPSRRSTRQALIALCLGAAGLLVGCGDGKKANTPDDTQVGSSADPQPVPDPAPESTIRPLEEGGGSSTTGHAGQTGATDPADDEYLLTHSDCNALADAYGRSWQNDEMTKLEGKGLKAAQYERAAKQISDGARDAADNWLSECQKIVGSAMLHSRLACAAKAKGMQRFNDCWDGKIK